FSVTIDIPNGSCETMQVCKTRAVGVDSEHRAAPLNPEWHLHKTQLAQMRNCAADVALWPIAKFVARRAEARVFVSSSFDGARLASFRSNRHQIGSQRPQQL